MKNIGIAQKNQIKIEVNAYLPVPFHGWALKNEIARYWDLAAPEYAKKQWDHLNSTKINHRLEWKSFLGNMLGKGICTILDAGCGSGILTSLLDEMGYLVTGVDLSYPMIAAARHYTALNDVFIRFKRGDLEFLPFPDRSFDAVVCRDVLWTTIHPERVVSEWMRILRPGGQILSIDRNRNIADRTIPEKICSLVLPETHVHAADILELIPDIRSALWSCKVSRPGYDMDIMQNAGFVHTTMQTPLPHMKHEIWESLVQGYSGRRFMISARKPGYSK